MMRYKDLYVRTINKWGVEAQCDQAVEECAELIASLKHLKRGKVSEDELIDELADVYLMLGQLIYMFGEDKFDAAVDRKILKLEKLLAENDSIS
jgi:NTP pyrophosphatase (non-canonical NTP hydrolase)